MVQSNQKRHKTKWRSELKTNFKIFAALLKNMRISCFEYILPVSLQRNLSVTCLLISGVREHNKGHFCLFCSIDMYTNEFNDLNAQNFYKIQTICQNLGNTPKTFVLLPFEKTQLSEKTPWFRKRICR